MFKCALLPWKMDFFTRRPGHKHLKATVPEPCSATLELTLTLTVWPWINSVGHWRARFPRSLVSGPDSVWCWSWSWNWSSNILATWCEEPTHWKGPWCWERLKTGGEDNRGWDGWLCWLNGHESEQIPGVGEGQGTLACCSSWGRKELDTTDRLNTTTTPSRQEQRQFSSLCWWQL